MSDPVQEEEGQRDIGGEGKSTRAGVWRFGGAHGVGTMFDGVRSVGRGGQMQSSEKGPGRICARRVREKDGSCVRVGYGSERMFENGSLRRAEHVRLAGKRPDGTESVRWAPSSIRAAKSAGRCKFCSSTDVTKTGSSWSVWPWLRCLPVRVEPSTHLRPNI